MAKDSQIAQVGKRKVELTNLSKVFYPDDGIVKAQLIEYYLKIAPTILAHVKGRPLTVIRFPDGIEGGTFYQKNKPDWAPEWIESIALGDEKKIEYILAGEPAALVWLANLACIELHQMHSRSPNYEHPDYFCFDLDPPDGYPFPKVAEIGMALREHVEGYGYHPFVKTTGRKGLHIVVPIEPKYSFHEAFEAAQAIAKPFVAANAKATTLHIKKEARKGRVLIDIYRNRGGQSIVSAYSVRGLAGAPVSCPVTWDELPDIQNLKELNIESVVERITTEGDPWEAIAAYSTELHTHRKAPKKKKKVPKSKKYKTPEQLEDYSRKREFSKTPEPGPGDLAGDDTAFVVHRHHASRLHYDLRLEQDGTLKSWAVPRGLPPRPGIKRMAIATEDHPIEYLTFNGEIPKGEYGGGKMWIYALGKYQITKQKKDGFYVRLQSREVNAEYRMYKTKNKEWLLERVDIPQADYLTDIVAPMLAGKVDKVPEGDEYVYEVKWDGIRAMISVDEGVVTIRSRNGRDITHNFPELNIPEEAFRATCALYDAEIVCLEESGHPNFRHVIHRIQKNSEGAIARARAKYPAVCYLFDCLYLDGRPLVHEPLEKRREWLLDSVKKGEIYRVSETVEEGVHLFEAAAAMGLEGIMAKERESTYQPGRRTTAWLKVKSRRTTECIIIGYTEGKGNRASAFGALHLAQQKDDLHYVGKVGTGFDDRMLKQVLTELKEIKKAKQRPIKEKPLDDAQTVWLEPTLICEVQYASLTSAGTLREPVFLRMRPDLTLD